jgi:hypothetical protein
MNINYVDYYGLYDDLDDQDFTFSTSDIYQQKRKKDAQRLSVYRSILGRVYKRIKECVVKEETYCFYEVPEMKYGVPLYNMRDCIIFIMNNLQSKGFATKYVDPHIIFVSWVLPKADLEATNAPIPKLIRDDPNPTQVARPIENYQAPPAMASSSSHYTYRPTITNSALASSSGAYETNRGMANTRMTDMIRPTYAASPYQPRPQSTSTSSAPGQNNWMFNSISNRTTF